MGRYEYLKLIRINILQGRYKNILVLYLDAESYINLLLTIGFISGILTLNADSTFVLLLIFDNVLLV